MYPLQYVQILVAEYCILPVLQFGGVRTIVLPLWDSRSDSFEILV